MPCFAVHLDLPKGAMSAAVIWVPPLNACASCSLKPKMECKDDCLPLPFAAITVFPK